MAVAGEPLAEDEGDEDDVALPGLNLVIAEDAFEKRVAEAAGVAS
eukprot:CAMPEP_0179144944 /NCGR_PEP_ID=MMETSP0796-20121207/69887_1 /TAXON_ID=73915 /ORGANISM="Pyrodinium bahamense, Strain pbaha01" /LENGTH=44 /DNA_ID= /DNA_START= /DNA_END= /DNA_ORIENTATION=